MNKSTLISVHGVGLVTSVGLNAKSACAAIRCNIDNFQETRFLDREGNKYLGSFIPLDQEWQGEARLEVLAARAFMQATANLKESCMPTSVILCLAEHSRAGRIIEDDSAFFKKLEERLGIRFDERSLVIAEGAVSVPLAMHFARNLITDSPELQIVIVATDSLLTSETLRYYEAQDRLLNPRNSNGFIPGEGGAALLVAAGSQDKDCELECLGLGFSKENSAIGSGTPLRGDGLASAIKSALLECGLEMEAVDFRIADVSGEQYYFKEATLALARTLRTRKEEFDIWHPAECVGNAGSALAGVILSVLFTSGIKGYLAGQTILAHFGSDDGKRAALILRWKNGDN